MTPLRPACIMPTMERPLKEAKARLRAQCLARRKALAPDRADAASRVILQRLLALDEYVGAERVHTYVSMDDEVDTDALIRLSLERRKRVFVPVVQPGSRVLRHAEIQALDQLQPGRWGLRQPAPDHRHWVEDLGTIDLVVVPGLAFDERGFRLGLGGGYYDRFLSRVRAPKIGLTYAFLLLREIPVGHHDVSVDIVLTESTTYRGGES